MVQIDAETLKKAHACMVEILEEIDRVCAKHNLTYWLESGTALGAVRHHGFIPWDDDCDIGMMRSDYEKFAKIAPIEFDKKFFFQTKDTDPYYKKRTRKVRMQNTKLVAHDDDFYEKFNQGIFVDIFVWDYYYGWEKTILKIFNIMPGIRSSRKKYPKHTLKRTIHGLLTAIPYAVHSAMELIYIGFRRAVRKNSRLPYIGYEAQQSDENLYRPSFVFPLCRDIEFEGKNFPVPNDYDAYLKQMYGDYMQLPPVEERRTHAKLIEC